MICPNCKNEVDEGATCPVCGRSLHASLELEPQEKPDTYLVWSILTTIFCCTIFGIVAIIYSVRVTSNFNAGNYKTAKSCSEKAKNWCIASAVLGIIVLIINLYRVYSESQHGGGYPYGGY